MAAECRAGVRVRDCGRKVVRLAAALATCALVFGMALPAPLEAQESSRWRLFGGGSDAKEAGAALPASKEAACLSEDFRVKCTHMCLALCKSPRFVAANSKACTKIFAQDRTRKDDAECANIASVSAKLDACLAKADAMPDYKAAIERVRKSEKVSAVMKALFDGFPDCVPSIPALTEKFNCLKVEGDDLTAVSRTLSQKEAYNQGTLERKELCNLPTNTVIDDHDKAEALLARTGNLLNVFNDIAQCRSRVAEWLSSRSSRGLPSLGGVMEQEITDLQNDLKPASKTELEVRNLGPRLQEQLGKMKTVMFRVLLRCAAK